MGRFGDQVQKIRSKNAGPFWLTVDIFCGDAKTFDSVCQKLKTQRIADIFGVPVDVLERYDIVSLHVIKFSLPRPVVQGSRVDRDMHGAQWAVLLEEMDF